MMIGLGKHFSLPPSECQGLLLRRENTGGRDEWQWRRGEKEVRKMLERKWLGFQGLGWAAQA